MFETWDWVHWEVQEDKVKAINIRNVQESELRKEKGAEQRDTVRVEKGPTSINTEINVKIKQFSQYAN